MTDTTLEPAAIEHLDWELACKTTYCQHDRPRATHVIVSPCCSTFACTPCAQETGELLRMAAREGRDVFCNHHPATSFRPHEVRIEPLA